MKDAPDAVLAVPPAPAAAAPPAPAASPGERLRSRLFDGAFALWTALFGLAIPVFWLCGSPPRAIRAATRLWVRGTLALLRVVVGLDHAVRGEAHRPASPCLVVANHQSTWETLAALVLFPDVAIVAKQELLTIPVFGWYLRRSPMIVIDRGVGAAALRDMVARSEAALAAGRSVLIFPEGTRRGVADPVVFKRGAELLYARLGAPVLPVALDSGRFWRPGDPVKRPGRIGVSLLPIIPPGLAGRDFTARAEAILEREKTRPAGQVGR